jgi:hypothetical protein
MTRFRVVEIRPEGAHVHLLPAEMGVREMQVFAAAIPYPTRLELEMRPDRWEQFTIIDGNDYRDPEATLARMGAEDGIVDVAHDLEGGWT